MKVKEKRPFDAMPKVAAAMSDAESALGARGRILVRYSGTENIARIMLEGEEMTLIERLASEIAFEIRAELGS